MQTKFRLLLVTDQGERVWGSDVLPNFPGNDPDGKSLIDELKVAMKKFPKRRSYMGAEVVLTAEYIDHMQNS